MERYSASPDRARHGMGREGNGQRPTVPVIDSWRASTKEKDAQGTPSQSHVSPNILVYQDTNEVVVLGGTRSLQAPAIKPAIVCEHPPSGHTSLPFDHQTPRVHPGQFLTMGIHPHIKSLLSRQTDNYQPRWACRARSGNGGCRVWGVGCGV